MLFNQLLMRSHFFTASTTGEAAGPGNATLEASAKAAALANCDAAQVSRLSASHSLVNTPAKQRFQADRTTGAKDSPTLAAVGNSSTKISGHLSTTEALCEM
eukprot:7181644-Pyramimonas_sp.AAC.1